MRPNIRFLTYLIAFYAVSGCASHYGAMQVDSTPRGAQVISLEDDSVVGVTPVLLVMKGSSERRQHIIVRLHKEGFYDKTDSFWMEMRHPSHEKASQDPQQFKVELEKKG